ncbi:envelope stress response membrane protein PspC [Paraglaciecola sp.]|uniref:envelope stress response membrane protein PspC n=1 Tax=Paraglaciecola sp. TaxID=1920173 RepID=UPI003EF6192B
MKTRKTLYRDPSKAKIAGVCAGIAEYFGMETWLVRILVVSGFFLLAGPFMFFGYIAAWFILEKKPRNITTQAHGQAFGGQTSQEKHAGKGWHNVSEEEAEKVVVKSKVWQAGEPPKQAFSDIKQQFEKNEERLRNVETYVTSSEFQLNQEINRL